MENPVTTLVTTSEKKAVTTFEGVLERLKEATGTKSDSALAKALGVKQSSVSSAKQRQQIPTHWVFQVSENYLFSSDWLFFGVPPKKLALDQQKEERGDEDDREAHQVETTHQDEPEEVDRAGETSVSNLLVKTAKILESRTIYSHALSQNIKGFHESVLMEEELYQIRTEHREFKNTIEKFKKELQKLREENRQLKEKMGITPEENERKWF